MLFLWNANYLNPRSKGKQDLELEYKSYVNVCVCVRACVCSYMCVKMTSSICVCVCRCACVRACAEKSLTSLCESFVILLVSPQRTTVLIAPGLQDAHVQSLPGSSSSELKITTDHEMPRTSSSRGTAMTGSKRTSSQIQSQRNATTWTWSVLPSRG